MIRNASAIPADTLLECDLCIVGGGAAGISIAKELAGTHHRVILLEGGGKSESAASRDLYRGTAWPEKSHEPLEENRRRQWGGSTAAWGGRCIPLDPVDFEKRDWIPHSGWPLTRADLDPFFARANILCEAGAPNYDAREVFSGGQQEIISGFDGDDVVSWPLERWGPPTHFGRRYAKDLASAENISVLLGANCLHIQLAENGSEVTRVDAASFGGNRFSVKARHFVVACGGLENARLLLNSNDVHKNGIGNGRDRVGRYYMSHLFGAFAWARLRDIDHGFIYDFEKDSDGVYCRRRFWITPEAQRTGQIGNAITFFFRPSLSQSVHRNALFSATYLAKFLLGTLKRKNVRGGLERIRKNRETLSEHLKIVVADAPGLLPQALAIVRGRYFAKRRLPFVLPPKKDNAFYLFYQTEHAPNPESRVVLDPARDAFGMQRLQARIAFTGLDVETVRRTHRLMRRQFEKTQTGELIYEETEMLEKLRDDIAHFNSSAHQIGTTRMGIDPGTSVVDADCRVHGTANLFATGTSVFPTSGHANPTLTLVALAVRLADHLKQELSS